MAQDLAGGVDLWVFAAAIDLTAAKEYTTQRSTLRVSLSIRDPVAPPIQEVWYSGLVIQGRRIRCSHRCGKATDCKDCDRMGRKGLQRQLAFQGK